MQSTTPNTKNPLRGILALVLITTVLCVFFGLISPRIVAYSPALQRYGAVQEHYGVRSSQVYYTDLATWQETQGELRYALSKITHKNK